MTTKFLRIAALTTSLLAAFAASAAADWSDNPFEKPRTKFGFGMLVGGFDVGSISGPAVGLHAEVGRQFGSLGVYGEYNMLTVGESTIDVEDPVRGMMHRGALNARYNVGEIGGSRDIPLRGVFWVEGGLGRHVVQWYDGGKLTRSDVGLGFGGQLDFRLGRREQPNIFGFYYAFRATVARSPEADLDLPATCAGPCDEATPPSPNDLGLFFNMGIEWGK